MQSSKNFATSNSVKEDNNMNDTSSSVTSTYNKEPFQAIPFWDDNYTFTLPSWAMPWYDIPGYHKFCHVSEMEDSEAFFSVLIHNENLRSSKSHKELKKMAEKYAKECLEAEKATKEVTNRRYFEALKQKYGDSLSVMSRDRSCGMDREETEIFMDYVRNAEWLQYIEQTAEEIHAMLMKNL